MEVLIFKAIVCPAKYDVELAHLAGPVLGHEALHEQAVTVADDFMEVVKALGETPAIEIIGVLEIAKACVLQ